MNPNWRSFLAAADAAFSDDSPLIDSFGDAAGELQAAARQTVVVPLTHLAVIEAVGEEVKPFLHNQLTSDVNHLQEGQAQHAAWCSAKGRMQASFLLWRADGGYRMALAADLLEATEKRLRMFILRAKVKLAARDDLVLLGLAGAQAGEALADAGLITPATALEIAVDGDCVTLRLDGERFIVAAPVAAAPDLWQKLTVKARPAGTPAWRWLDVRAALPLVTLATKEEFVPQMADFEKIGGVSFHKGCYPGQEIVARAQYLGKVKRHLYRLASAAPLQAGDDLFSPDNPDQSSGKVMSAAPAPNGGFAALAVVQSNFAAHLHIGSHQGPPVEAVAVHPA
ncbi:MAG: folate-binding protein [Betaproteobacteria bacterium]|nr:folate-binding protein [Betaproteobacteria bacterium]MCL2887548.1 folate-binding protein [Betaproteobacteria bacterium]